MPTWTVTTEHIRRTGRTQTTAQAWDAAHEAAADVIRARVLDQLTLEVDGQRSTIRPAESGDELANIEATLRVIEDGRRDIVAAHLQQGDDALQ